MGQKGPVKQEQTAGRLDTVEVAVAVSSAVFAELRQVCGGQEVKTRCFHGFEKMGMGSEDVEVVGVEYSSETAEQRKKKKKQSQRQSQG